MYHKIDRLVKKSRCRKKGIKKKKKKNKLKFLQGSVTVLLKMANYEKARVKLINIRLID